MSTQQRLSSRTLTRWADVGPVVLGLVLFAVAALFLVQERARAAAEVRAEIEVTAEQVGARLSVWIDNRLEILEQFARSRGEPTRTGPADFRREAQIFIERIPGFRAINWIDAEGTVRYAEPERGNPVMVGSDLTEHPSAGVRRAVERSLETLLPTRTPWISFPNRGTGFSVFWPVETPGESYGGLVNGVFDLDFLITQALPDVRFNQRFVVELSETDGAMVFGTGNLNASGSPYRIIQTVEFADQPLSLTVQPRRAPATWLLGTTFALVLAFAAVVSIAVAVLLRAYLLRQAEVSQQEAYNRLLLDSTSEGLIGVDLQGQCTFCNSASLELLGRNDAHALVGRAGLSWIADGGPATGHVISLELYSAIREGRIFETRQACALRADGRHFDVTLRSHPVREHGVLTGALISFSDVTAELREAERAHRLTAVLLQVPEMVALMDTTGRLVFMNPAARRELGVEDHTGLDALRAVDFLTPAEIERISNHVFPSVGDGELWQGDVTLRTRNGAQFPTHMVVMRHSDHHGELYFSAIARDLRAERTAESDRLALEEQFREAQRTESLGLLAGSIAHDFNNMLVGVLGNASLALEQLERSNPAWRHVSQVQTATEHAAELVGQLLAYSGRGRFEARTVDLSRLVDEMSSLLRTSIDKRVRLEVDCEAARGVLADATQLRQLVMNLITNASDAIEAEGTVNVQVEAAHWPGGTVDGHLFSAPLEAGDYVRIRVADDGAGMKPEVVSHIFDPFFTTKDEGKGLGLAAVLGIVKGHDGFLHLRSTPGKGTTFDVYFPFSPEEVPTATREAEEPIPLHSARLEGTVLLVDDEPGVRHYLEAALETMGLTVICCEDGGKALEVFRSRHEELVLVLLDQSMPGLPGDAVWREMQALNDGIPGLLMSGYDEVRIDDSIDTLGFSGFLQKPFRFHDLRDAVAELLAPTQESSAAPRDQAIASS